MTASGIGHDPERADDALARGDLLARQADWSGAVAHWRMALAGRHAAEASQRIRWFLDHTTRGSHGSVPAGNRRNAYRALLASALAAAAGTAVTLLGMADPGLNGTIVAAVAWTFFFGAMALMIVFPRLLDSPADRPGPLMVDDPAAAAAASRASDMERAHASANASRRDTPGTATSA